MCSSTGALPQNSRYRVIGELTGQDVNVHVVCRTLAVSVSVLRVEGPADLATRVEGELHDREVVDVHKCLRGNDGATRVRAAPIRGRRAPGTIELITRRLGGPGRVLAARGRLVIDSTQATTSVLSAPAMATRW